ncbi:helicase-related protein [Gemmatimonas sp.]|uniref:helicase-related protein n=1 Tax=Gemmatimonas sp. TaxID=1962908 RepID=UPI003566139B
MARLEELTKGSRIRGISPAGPVTVIDAEWIGSDVLNLTYEDPAGNVERELIYRTSEPEISLDGDGRPWSLDADPELFLLASEAKRIQLAYLFDPFLAAETSDVDPLPHQIEAVYEEMLTRQPLRYLLADDPGAGKTIMAGLLIKELVVRGDLDRCLVVAPGGLVEQWQDELGEKFGLEFDLLTRELVEASRTGNPFTERPLMIARLDMLSRNEELVDRLAQTEWDLIVVDEAHKMSATYFGQEVKETKRYRLGKRLGEITRNLLLMSATPHNGRPEDFQLFMALIDGDRFAGKFRKGAHGNEPPRDLMRRMVKEELLRFDGTKLFPERVAYTAKYPLSPLEAALYERVSDYVREGMNRAERLADGGRKNVVGFALTILQRRLASSPLAISRSLERRRRRLTAKLDEAKIGRRAAESGIDLIAPPRSMRLAEFEDFDPDDLLDSEVEDIEEEVVDAASAARTIAELEAELFELSGLEDLARKVLASGEDRKWDELARLLENTPEMLDEFGALQKLIVFTEHRDTLDYLVEKLGRLLGRDNAIVSIHGGVRREERRKAQERFTQDRDVVLMVATDAAGEGLNLQRAHLMINYDLPWNPNRIEQRFGRIHRIGQQDVCRLWNLVAEETREGQVFEQLLSKLEEQRKALGGKVFDVLGEAFSDKSLRDLLIEAIRAENPALQQARAKAVIDVTVGDRMKELIDAQSLLTDILSPGHVADIREQMQRAQAHKLQPSYIRRFFLEGFEVLGGRAVRREPGRFQITRVPGRLRQYDTTTGLGRLLPDYERVCFEREHINENGKPTAALVAPGHSLLESTIGVLLERHGSLLQKGAVLVDPNDPGLTCRALVYLEHEITDGTTVANGQRRVVSKRFEYVEIDEAGEVADAGYHPYIDYRQPTADERDHLAEVVNQPWIRSTLTDTAQRYAIENNAPKHLAEVEARVHARIDAISAAVEHRLSEEIRYWDAQALKLKDQELAGKRNAKANSARARQRADEAADRLERRRAELALERKLSARQPRVVGGALVVPAGLLAKLLGTAVPTNAADTERSDRLAMEAVMATEKRIGRPAKRMPHNNKGYDVETRRPDGTLIFIEVKGRVVGATDFTITASEVLCGLNNGANHILALVEIAEDDSTIVRYLYDPFTGREAEPGFAEHKRVLGWSDYWTLATRPD